MKGVWFGHLERAGLGREKDGSGGSRGSGPQPHLSAYLYVPIPVTL